MLTSDYPVDTAPILSVIGRIIAQVCISFKPTQVANNFSANSLIYWRRELQWGQSLMRVLALLQARSSVHCKGPCCFRELSPCQVCCHCWLCQSWWGSMADTTAFASLMICEFKTHFCPFTSHLCTLLIISWLSFGCVAAAIVFSGLPTCAWETWYFCRCHVCCHSSSAGKATGTQYGDCWSQACLPE